MRQLCRSETARSIYVSLSLSLSLSFSLHIYIYMRQLLTYSTYPSTESAEVKQRVRHLNLNNQVLLITQQSVIKQKTGGEKVKRRVRHLNLNNQVLFMTQPSATIYICVLVLTSYTGVLILTTCCGIYVSSSQPELAGVAGVATRYV